MGRLEVQGIVSASDKMPRVQFRQIDDNGEIEAEWQAEIIEAREMAQHILEATFNAIYDAALYAFTEEHFPEDSNIGAHLVGGIRRFRADHWGLPDQPKDWRTDGGTED